jgi:hypothetical protein
MCLMALLAVCITRVSSGAQSARVLFFGNSVTYVGNLPAVLSALCTASGMPCSTEMIARGGATLTDRVADGSLDRATANGRFDYLILQERGGDIMGAFMNQIEAQERAETAAATLVRAARERRMEPVLLGTYQGSPAASRELVTAEQVLASKLDAAYVPVSNYLDCGRRQETSLRWFDRDGMHPGPELTLMMAVLLYRELFGVAARRPDCRSGTHLPGRVWVERRRVCKRAACSSGDGVLDHVRCRDGSSGDRTRPRAMRVTQRAVAMERAQGLRLI